MCTGLVVGSWLGYKTWSEKEPSIAIAFIEMDPVAEGKRAREFIVLEKPPFFKTDEPGRHRGGHAVATGIVRGGQIHQWDGELSGAPSRGIDQG